MTQLREYEPIYLAEKITLENDQQSLEVQCNKRTIHQIEMDNRLQDNIENTTDDNL